MRVRAAVNSAKPLQFEAPIPVRASSSHLEPGVVGIVRPILLLPEGIAAHLTPEELRAIVAHEVCHLRRQDNLTAAIHMLVEAIFWFYPLVWWLGARLIDERERACDEAVVRSGNDPEVYAEGILKVCRFYVAAPVACAAGVTGADLKKRIESIMTHRLTVQLTLAKKVMLAAAFCVLALIVFEGSGSAVRAQDAAFSGRALVFRDIPSWNRHPDFEDVLRDLAFQYDAKPSSDMSRTELSQYAFIVIPGAQWGTNYYKAFADNAPVLDRYVRDGGTLVVEMNGAERAGITLPGGVSMVLHPAFDNLITLPNHPILAPLAGKPRITANLASHGYLMGVPSGALVLAAEMARSQIAADMTRPTFVEYSYGKGHVIAAAQCFHDQDDSGRGPLMATVLKYAAAGQWFSSAAAPMESVAKAPPELAVEPSIFDRYVGYYQFPASRIMTVSRSGERYLIQLTGQPPAEIYPKSEREYFAKTVDAQVTFVTSANGSPALLILHQHSRDLTAPRIDAALARALLDSLERRIRDGMPAPGSEDALRRQISGEASGKPDFDRMTPELADAVRVQLPVIRNRLASLGALQTVQFSKVEPDGSDLYEVTFEHGRAPWHIGLNPDGITAFSLFGRNQ
jgi:hypothetical protein